MLWFKFARRYMFSPKSHSVINIIASVSVVAVMIPTAAMIILLSMFEGLHAVIDDIYSSVDGDIEVIAARGQTFATESIDYDKLREVEGVEAVAPYLEQSIMASASGRHTTLLLRGVDSTYFDTTPIANHTEQGSYASIAAGDIILGSVAASNIGAYGIGSEIELYALNRRQLSTVLPSGGVSRHTTHLGGIAHTNAEIDATLALYDITRAQQLLNYPDRFSGVAVKCREGVDIESVQNALRRVVGTDFEVRTRDQKYASMYSILRLERFAIVLIGSLIALVAAFAIVGSVVMLIADKRRDIATLHAMGGDVRLIRRIFVGEGMLLTLTGCLAGVVLGAGLSWGQQYFGWVKIPGNMVMESYPVALTLGNICIVVAVVVIIGWLVTRLSVGFTLRNKEHRL